MKKNAKIIAFIVLIICSAFIFSTCFIKATIVVENKLIEDVHVDVYSNFRGGVSAGLLIATYDSLMDSGIVKAGKSRNFTVGGGSTYGIIWKIDGKIVDYTTTSVATWDTVVVKIR